MSAAGEYNGTLTALQHVNERLVELKKQRQDLEYELNKNHAVMHDLYAVRSDLRVELAALTAQARSEEGE